MVVAAKPVNIFDLSRKLRVSRQTLYNWRDEGCPLDEGEEAVMAWVAARKQLKEQESEEADDLKERKLRAECAKLEAEAEAKELKNAIARGEVMNTDTTMQAVRSMIAVVKIRFEDIPLRLQMEFPPDSRDYWTERLADEIRLALVEMSQQKIEEPPQEEVDDGEE